MLTIKTAANCTECDRRFDLLDEEQAGEWFSGHDCEPLTDDELLATLASDIEDAQTAVAIMQNGGIKYREALDAAGALRRLDEQEDKRLGR